MTFEWHFNSIFSSAFLKKKVNLKQVVPYTVVSFVVIYTFYQYTSTLKLVSLMVIILFNLSTNIFTKKQIWTPKGNESLQ